MSIVTYSVTCVTLMFNGSGLGIIIGQAQHRNQQDAADEQGKDLVGVHLNESIE